MTIKEYGKYLYIGCGNHRMPMFTHADINLGKNKNGSPEIFCDITKHIPLPDNHVTLIFSRGTMEHLTYAELINCLLENYRILKRGGLVRMLVPDLDIMMDNFLNKKEHADENRFHEMDRWDLYYRMPRKGYNETFINQVLNHDHYYLHNFHTLSKALKSCGFTNIRKVNPGETHASEISKILKDAETGRTHEEILIEAEKGPYQSNLKILNKPMPKNLLSYILAKFFNIRITSFIKRQGFFPQRKWFDEKKISLKEFMKRLMKK